MEVGLHADLSFFFGDLLYKSYIRHMQMRISIDKKCAHFSMFRTITRSFE